MQRTIVEKVFDEYICEVNLIPTPINQYSVLAKFKEIKQQYFEQVVSFEFWIVVSKNSVIKIKE